MSWCLQITRNEAVRLIGRRRELLSPRDSSALNFVLDDSLSGDEAERTVQRLDVRRALDELDPADRLLLALRYGGGCSHPEIATTLGISETAARIRLHRLHKRVKRLL